MGSAPSLVLVAERMRNENKVVYLQFAIFAIDTFVVVVFKQGLLYDLVLFTRVTEPAAGLAWLSLLGFPDLAWLGTEGQVVRGETCVELLTHNQPTLALDTYYRDREDNNQLDSNLEVRSVELLYMDHLSEV